MINLQAEYQKYCEQAAECATFLARYRYEEWESLTEAERREEADAFLQSQEKYRLPFAWLERKCWMKRALTILARMWYVEEERELDETLEALDQYLADITEAFIRVFPEREKLVNRKKESVAEYYRGLRKKYQWRKAENGYYRMILDANGWDECPEDTEIVLPPAILRQVGTEAELVLLALLYHYRSESEMMLINQGDFGNWFAYSSGKGGEQRLSDLAKNWPEYVEQQRAGTESNAPSKFCVSEPLRWRDGEPGVLLTDDGSHMLARQLLAFQNAARLFPGGLAGMTDDQILLLAEIAKANVQMGVTRCPSEWIRLVKDPALVGFYLAPPQAEAFVAQFGVQVQPQTLEDWQALPEALRKAAFAEAWRAADWLEPPYKKKLSEEGKSLNLQARQTYVSWQESLVLLAHLADYDEAACPTEGKGKYAYMERPAMSPADAACYGGEAESARLFALFEETAAVCKRIRVRIRKSEKADFYRYAIVKEWK